jgi:voltage-gated potassium channel
MYFIENEGQPNKFSSIPQTMWWTVSTLTTVGYGDMIPITPLGQFFGGIISIIGIAFFALPAGILASGFSQELRIQYSSEKIVCPDCGHHFSPDHKH